MMQPVIFRFFFYFST
ncbi:pheST operon leader peptide PheM [Yersinia ruckeri]|nr:pheST operon leader peptide PheM [Yersinia ruckeri]EKN3360943.1 pheST operon leader peptide PheM [Yersinia ruckeri]EKN4181209.1 pheST operon leader peptide PheM [Yersinia ruckeri]EKN4196713.1 pheST operon leader peptide PheM [Yersinia ruckeri]EKN4200740.1 pheST operon leader peptide PheM [Yersinia ruckeri]